MDPTALAYPRIRPAWIRPAWIRPAWIRPAQIRPKRVDPGMVGRVNQSATPTGLPNTRGRVSIRDPVVAWETVSRAIDPPGEAVGD